MGLGHMAARVAHDFNNLLSASTGSVRVEVEDDGPGMTEAIRDRILTPFFSTKAKGQGTGLGLATVDSIVRASGGQLNITSEVGKGSSFAMVLPTNAPN